MNKYRDKSDVEINKAVAIALGNVIGIRPDSNIIYLIGGDELIEFAPCNNPADAMPIIIENGIGMNYIDKDIGWCAYHFDEEKGELEIYDKNYYRAAMICFLIMKDEENEKV
ncbi:phage protein NinX family protein [Morganella morganii]|uniref:phage protein NinX family protein n=1 Tax=Morganella morganii TaxID=582 RepID=UPI0023677186|nr:phage protein NinX family protein [Morganella morganii]